MSEGKQYGGLIDFWCIHDVSDLFDENEIDVPPKIMTGRSIDEPLRRWRAGAYMRSTRIVQLDLENLIVETENTIYKLVGPGRLSRSNPYYYAFSVDRTAKLLSSIRKVSREELGADELYFPREK